MAGLISNLSSKRSPEQVADFLFNAKTIEAIENAIQSNPKSMKYIDQLAQKLQGNAQVVNAIAGSNVTEMVGSDFLSKLKTMSLQSATKTNENESDLDIKDRIRYGVGMTLKLIGITGATAAMFSPIVMGLLPIVFGPEYNLINNPTGLNTLSTSGAGNILVTAPISIAAAIVAAMIGILGDKMKAGISLQKTPTTESIIRKMIKEEIVKLRIKKYIREELQKMRHN